MYECGGASYDGVIYFYCGVSVFMSDVDQVLIRCDLGEQGMFPTEITVKIHTSDGSIVSLLADRSLVYDRGQQHYLIATKYRIESDDSIVCLLPSDATDTGTRWIRVRSGDLLQAA
jgi:hypothetical protein